PWQGEKNHGFDVLYHNMKHGQISTKELADFVRERAAIEENYAKAMVKLSKMATNGTQLGTFAPLWEVFRISSDKLALCHLELMKKLHDLIKEISRYGEEQGRVHKKSKEEVSGTLEAVQLLHGVAQLLPKSKESYHSKCQEYERLRKEGTSQKEIDKAELKSRKAGEALRRAVDKYNAARADFEQRMLDSAMHFQEVEEAHLRHMKGLIGSYSHSVEDTHVQIGQVHEEFKQNVENIGTEMLLRRFAESKGTGRERPGALDFDEYRLAPAQEGKYVRIQLGIPGAAGALPHPVPAFPRTQEEPEQSGCPEVDEDGFTVRPDIARSEAENPGCSSSDSDYDEDEPRKFYVHIKPVQPREASGSAEATVEQLKATVGNLILAPGVGVSLGGPRGFPGFPGSPQPCPLLLQGTVRRQAGPGKPPQDTLPSAALFGPPLESAFEAEEFPAPRAYVLTSSSSPFSSSSPENVEDSGLDSPSHPAPGPSPDSRPWTPQPGTPQSPLPKPDPPLPPPSSSAWAPRPRSPSGRLPEPPNFAVFSGPGAEGLWGDGGAAPRGRSRCLSGPIPREAPSPDPFGEPPAWGRPRSPGGEQPPPTRLSRGPSPVVLGSQDALPVATAFTEYVHAYFKGRDADRYGEGGGGPGGGRTDPGGPGASPDRRRVPGSCLVKVTGELTMSFPAGIVRVFSGTAAPPVLSFRLLNAGAIEQFLPNAELLYRMGNTSQTCPGGETQDPGSWTPPGGSQTFPRMGSTGRGVLNPPRVGEGDPGMGNGNAELGKGNLEPGTGDADGVRKAERCGWVARGGFWGARGGLRTPRYPGRNLEEKRLLWKLLDVPGAPGQGGEAGPALLGGHGVGVPTDPSPPNPCAVPPGCGRLSASWEPLGGPSKPSPVAAQFSSEGSTLSGVEVELAGAGYRMSLVKKRFATGTALEGV
ncbi:FCHO1 protein, partial [Aphelocoma coerulescens]|nr:FCHO1 protein [Aphelocoma coerulescens]